MYGIPRGKHAQKNGGPVTGPGTGTSDSIKAEVPAGSYIMPADSTAALGLGVPGYNGKPKASARQQPGLGVPGYRKQVPVNLSNGEHELPPEQVHAVGVQALEQAKSATHAPVPEQNGPELFFANGGLVEDPTKKGFGVPGYNGAARPPAPEQPQLGVPGNPGRAARLQAQAQQPVTGPRGVTQPDKQANPPAAQPGLGVPGYNGQPKAQPSPAPGLGVPRGAVSEPSLMDVPRGLARAAIGAFRTPAAAVDDAVRNVAVYAAGGDPSTLEGGSAKYRDRAVGEVTGGLAQAGDGLERFRAAGREALGVQPLAQPGTTPETPDASAAAGDPAAPATTTAPGLGWRRTGIGADRQGGEIAARMDANGVAEFTNETATPGAVTNAEPSPGLGLGFARRGAPGAAPAPGLGVGFARRGSASNVGNGVGTFSQGEAGDAEMAQGRFERANQIRAEMNANRPREVGDNGGRVTGVADSSRAPSVAEVMRTRQDARQAQTEALRAQTQQGTVTNNQRMQTEQLSQQSLQQQIAAGQYSLEDRQRRADLEAQLADPNLQPEQRAQLEAAYYALNADAKDRYMEVRGGTDAQGVKAASQVFDRRTGSYVDSGQSGPRRTSVTRAEVEQTAKEEGLSASEVVERLQSMGVVVN